MASTKTFLTSKDSIVVLRNADGGSLGAGKDYHIYVGNSGDYTIRGLVQFDLNFTDVTSITSAKLYFTTPRSSDGTVGGYLRDTHGTWTSAAMYVSRNTSSWTEGTYGADEAFNGVNSVEWSNQPSTTTSNRVSYTPLSSRPSSPTITPVGGLDITGIVTDWFNGQPNYGVQLKFQSEVGSRYVDFYSREGDASAISGAVAPYIVLTYETVANPTITSFSPTSGSVAKIVNLDDTTEWTSTSQNAMPQFTWQYATGGGGAQTSWRLRIYNNGSKTTTYYDSGLVVDAAHKADQTFSPVKNADKQAWIPGAGWSTGVMEGLVNGTAYYWTIQVYDALGNASAESTPTAFKVRWGQAVYEFDTLSTTTGAWNFTHTQPPAKTQAVPIFRAVTSAGTTTGAWSLDESAISGSKRYLQVLLRMSTDDGTTQPYVDDIYLSYSDSAVTPDNWVTTGGSSSLSSTTRRFGTRSAIATASTAAEMYLQPLRNTGEYDIPVTRSTRYTFSAYIKPNAISPRSAKIRVFKSTGLVSSISGLSEIYNIDGQLGSEAIEQTLSPTAIFPSDIEGWSRVTYTFDTDSSTDFVKPIIYMSSAATATPNSIYVDGVKFEEGNVVSSWSPGSVTQSVVYEGAGISIDASKGGTIRLRGTSAGARDIVEIGSNGLDFGGLNPASVYSGSASELNITGNVLVTKAIKVATAGADPAVYIGDDSLIFDADTADTMGIQGQQTAANGGIVFGSGKDTNIYRSAANTLKTDDAFTAAGNISSSGYIGAGGRLYFDSAFAGVYLGLGGSSRIIQAVNAAGGGSDIWGSSSSTIPGILGTKSIAGQPTTNVNGSGTTDAFADAVRNGGMVLDNSNQRFYVYSSTAWRYAALTNPSDSRLKEEITEISGAIDKLRQLVPVAFKWKAPHLHERTDSVGDDGTRLGFIADQVATTDLKHWVETMHIGGEEAEIATGSTDETPVLAVNIPQNEIEALFVQAIIDIDTRLRAIEDSL